MRTTRRHFLAGVTSLAVSHALLRDDVLAQPKRTRIVLLGTKGGPRVGEIGRSNPSTLLLINDVPYVVDCGYGVSKQLINAGVALNRVRYMFITARGGSPRATSAQCKKTSRTSDGGAYAA